VECSLAPASSATPTPAIEFLRKSAEDALTRNFAILAVQPNDKEPLTKYSPHAVHSATKDPKVALRPWNDGIPANYGIDPSQSNLAIVDVDKGLNSPEEFEDWRKKNNLPETFTVLTGREPFGVHMYFAGSESTQSFALDGVTGEVKSKGGYVIGPGSCHPSGKRYKILKDLPFAPLPDVFKRKGKPEKSEKSKTSVLSSLIPSGNRNPWQTAIAGHLINFKNGALSEEAIYQGIRALTKVSCEDGEAYTAANDKKIREMATYAKKNFEVNPLFAPKRMSHAELIAEAEAGSQIADIVKGLISRKTVNIGVGDSGLGKTPFCFQMALCIAFGRSFIGQECDRGRILIADYENYTGTWKLLNVLAGYLGIPTPIDGERLSVIRNPEQKDLAREIEDFRPSLVIVDSLRGYNSRAEVDNSAASDMIAKCQTVAQANDCAWMFIHHPRKQDRNIKAIERPDLFKIETPVIEWLEEAAGPRALINQAHTRLGFAKPKNQKNSELGLRGFVKGQGEVGPWLIDREYDSETGQPIGYKRVRGSDLLSLADKGTFSMLPVDVPMRFCEVLETLFAGNESKKKFVSSFLTRCIDAGVIVEAGKDRTPSKTYTRIKESQ